jgi:hypothetical protein
MMAHRNHGGKRNATTYENVTIVWNALYLKPYSMKTAKVYSVSLMLMAFTFDGESSCGPVTLAYFLLMA